MNKRQKQVQQSLLNSEIDVLNALEESYQKALNDINGVIAKLLARKDTENLQAIIYQLKYQRLLKSEIEGFLNALHTQNYQLIDDYLKDSYITAHIGTLFDLQGQGVPLILPLNQEQMISAITINSKLSAPLYNTLGYDVEHLKINVVSEISRGIAQRLTYAEMARNLSAKTKLSKNRTKEKGAKIFKQWDSTLDRKTRPTHRELDGQMIGVNDYFHSSGGGKALYPGGFGDPKEDCNCRCCLVQVAEWELSDDAFTKMNGVTNELQHFESIDDYNKFKKKFWEVTK